jgi:hypothetical protein
MGDGAGGGAEALRPLPSVLGWAQDWPEFRFLVRSGAGLAAM